MRAGALRLICSVVLCCLLSQQSASAALLELTKTTPDLLSSGIGLNYAPGAGTAGTFYASGLSSQLDVGGATAPYSVTGSNRRFVIDIRVDESTGQPVDGALTANGNVAALGFTTGTLLTGSLVGFGFMNPPGGGTLFEFTFDVTGGAAASLFGGRVGIIYNAVSISPAFTGTFTSAFTSGSGTPPNLFGSGTADTFAVVPEPSSLAALAVASLLLCARPKRNVH